MGELYNPFPKLPKNIRQIGERDQIVKLYVEDYVNTYLKRLYPVVGQSLRVGILLGSMEMTDGTPYIFVDGALEMENISDGDKVEFSETAWKKAYQCTEQMFPRRIVVGWFLCTAKGCDLSPVNYWKQHMQYFQGPHKLMYLNSSPEDGESIYITSEDGFYKLQGYSIFYEKNQMMQDYMVLRKDTKKEETEANDKVIRDYKKRLESRKEEAEDKHQTVSLLGGLCTAMSIVILAGGIVMFNNYGRMRSMEGVIASALPEKAGTVLMGKGSAGKTDSHVIVEEAEGGVYPTTAAVTKETMASVEPGREAVTEKSDQAPGQEAAAGDQAGQAAGAETGKSAQPGNADSGKAAQPGSTEAGKAAQSGNAEAGKAAQSGNAEAGKAAQSGNAEAGKAAQSGNAESGKTAQSGSTEADKKAQAGTGAYRTHVVLDGETLYGICLSEYQTMNMLQEICELNGLEDENKIVSGQKLLLP